MTTFKSSFNKKNKFLTLKFNIPICKILCCLNCLSGFLNSFSQRYDTTDPIPNGHERNPQKETKGPSKLSHEGLKRVNEDFFHDLGVLRDCPKAHGKRAAWEILSSPILKLVHELVLLITARPLAPSQLRDLRRGRIHENFIPVFK